MRNRSLLFMAAFAGIGLMAVNGLHTALAQTAPPAPPAPPAVSVTVKADAPELSPQLVQLISELKAQNKQLVANQAEIDGRITQLTETIRQARIFAARAGRGGVAK